MNLNELHEAYLKDPLLVDEFASELTTFITKIVKSECRHSSSMYHTLEDVIGESLLDVWKNLSVFDASKSQFTTFVRMVIQANIIDIFRKYKKRDELQYIEERGDQSYVDERAGYPGFTKHHQYPISSNYSDSLSKEATFGQLISTLNKQDKSFIKKKLEGLSEAELDTFFSRRKGWANDKWRYIKVKLHALNYGF